MTAPVVALLVLAGFAVAAAAAVAWLRRSRVVVTVSGESMEPTLRHGDRVLVRRVGVARVRRGDVVVVAPGRPVPGERLDRWMVKRVVAVPGDPVPRLAVPALSEVPEAVVPDGRLVVLGDNPSGSSDSRELGYFHGELLLGVVRRTPSGPRHGGQAAESPPR